MKDTSDAIASSANAGRRRASGTTTPSDCRTTGKAGRASTPAEADRHWPGIKAAADDPRLDDERFATARGRRKAGADLVAVLDEAFARRTRAEWATIFAEHDVWWTPVNTAADLIDDPQARAAGVFVDVPGGPTDGEPVRSVATPVVFGDAPLAPAAGPPLIGADSDVLLHEIGVDPAEVRRLREAGVVAGPPTSTGAPGPSDD
ncbi:hypothetical protein Acsp07_49330 [Actinomycetospora sp. NBRC 106378]|nr:hypothetical protein Acsp07_49330 [Actinomycetospora sp. NBRC 106378]